MMKYLKCGNERCSVNYTLKHVVLPIFTTKYDRFRDMKKESGIE